MVITGGAEMWRGSAWCLQPSVCYGVTAIGVATKASVFPVLA